MARHSGDAVEIIQNFLNMQKLAQFFLLILITVGVQAQTWLDKPIQVSAGENALAALAKITNKLTEDDRFYFEQAYSAFIAEFTGTKVYAIVPETEREKALNAFIDGLTPRKILIAGLMLRARQHNQRDDYGSQLTGPEKASRNQHMHAHSKEADEMVVYAFQNYCRTLTDSKEK